MSQQSIHDRIMSRNTNAPVIQGLAADQVTPGRKRWKAPLLSLLAIAVAGAAGYAVARYDVIGSLLSQRAIAAANDANQALPDTPFVQHAKKADLRSCSTVFPVLGQLLTNGAQYNVQSVWNSNAADKHAVQALVGMKYATPGYNGSAAGIVFAAPIESGCEGSMIRVAPFTGSCPEILSKLPNGSKLVNNLEQIGVYELGNDGGNAMLLPTGNGCVVISVASAAGKQDGAK